MTDAANDAGGMSKEWFSIICEQLLDPEKGEIDDSRIIQEV